MKHIKSCLSVLLALALGLALFMPAFAADAAPAEALVAEASLVPQAEEDDAAPWWAYLVTFLITVPLGLPVGFLLALLGLPLQPLVFPITGFFAPLVRFAMVAVPVVGSVVLPSMLVFWLLSLTFGFNGAF